MIFGQDPTAALGWMRLLIETGSAGLLWYLIIWAWPQARKDYREEMAESRRLLREMNLERSAERALVLQLVEVLREQKKCGGS